MRGPSWIPDTFAAIMLAVAAVSAARLAVVAAARRGLAADTDARRWLAVDADADGAHLLMSIAMAGMLAAGLQTLPAGVWEPAFGVLAIWFAGRVAVEARGQGARGWVRSCHAPHLVHSVAMLYMFLALRTATGGGAGTGMGGMSAAGGQVLAVPTLALVLALLLAGYAVRDLDRFTAPAAGWLAQPAPVGAGVCAGTARAGVCVGTAGAGVSVATGGAATVTLASTAAWPPFSKQNPAGPPAASAGGKAGPPAASAGGKAGPPAASAGGRTVTGAGEWVPACCRIVMGVTMAYMLIIMI
jgi:hypothetical protein